MRSIRLNDLQNPVEFSVYGRDPVFRSRFIALKYAEDDEIIVKVKNGDGFVIMGPLEYVRYKRSISHKK